MRIHLNLPEHKALDALNDARRAAGVIFERASLHGSRSHTLAVDVILSGDSPHRINSGQYGYENAASWDQWGIFLAVLYAADDTAKSWAYFDRFDFHEKTGGRFDFERNPNAVRSMTSPGYQRTSHKWERTEVVTGRTIARCVNRKHGECTAVVSW